MLRTFQIEKFKFALYEFTTSISMARLNCFFISKYLHKPSISERKRTWKITCKQVNLAYGNWSLEKNDRESQLCKQLNYYSTAKISIEWERRFFFHQSRQQQRIAQTRELLFQFRLLWTVCAPVMILLCFFSVRFRFHNVHTVRAAVKPISFGESFPRFWRFYFAIIVWKVGMSIVLCKLKRHFGCICVTSHGHWIHGLHRFFRFAAKKPQNKHITNGSIGHINKYVCCIEMESIGQSISFLFLQLWWCMLLWFNSMRYGEKWNRNVKTIKNYFNGC